MKKEREGRNIQDEVERRYKGNGVKRVIQCKGGASSSMMICVIGQADKSLTSL